MQWTYLAMPFWSSVCRNETAPPYSSKRSMSSSDNTTSSSSPWFGIGMVERSDARSLPLLFVLGCLGGSASLRFLDTD